MRISFLILFLSLAFTVNGQQQSPERSLNPAAESRVQAAIRNLKPGNSLRLSLEQGDRGDGVHHAWMDKMRQFGIRQASFTIDFEWQDGIESLKIKRIFFLREYYRYDVNTHIEDQHLLRQIREVGLEQELRAAILVRATTFVPNIMKGVARTTGVQRHRAHGTIYINLLDDEALPIVDDMPDVEW